MAKQSIWTTRASILDSIHTMVYDILRYDKKARDDDRIVMLKVWRAEVLLKGVDFFEGFLSGTYSSPESIRRERQKLQAKYPGLRGKKFDKRRVFVNRKNGKE